MLDGVPVFARASQLPAAPDLALICTPPHTVAGLIGEPGALGTRAVVIVTAVLVHAGSIMKWSVAASLRTVPCRWFDMAQARACDPAEKSKRSPIGR